MFVYFCVCVLLWKTFFFFLKLASFISSGRKRRPQSSEGSPFRLSDGKWRGAKRGPIKPQREAERTLYFSYIRAGCMTEKGF